MDTYTVTKRQIEWDRKREFPLGRNVNHDSRSRFFAFVPEKVTTLKTVYHNRIVAILNQGMLGSCTGNGAAGVLGTEPFYATLDPTLKIDEPLAVRLYSMATGLDGFEGQYPPEDTGSDGLSVAKAMQQLGYISGYQHAFDFNAALQAIVSYPIITGFNWYDSMDYPDSTGLVSISPRAEIAGGHEVEVLGIDLENKKIQLANSWGTGWGYKGYFSMSFDTYERLLSEQGDATILLPLSVPAPTPTPVPVPSTSDAIFAQKIQAWLNGNPWFYKGTAQKYIKEWLKAKGYAS